MGTGPGEINKWMLDWPDGELLEWSPDVVDAETVAFMPFLEVGGVRDFTWHMEADHGSGGGFALVGGLAGPSVSAGLTLTIPLPVVQPPDWI